MMHAAMALGVLVVVFPMLYGLIVSTQSAYEYGQAGNLMPGTSLLDNYQRAWEKANLGALLSNTFVVALGVALGRTGLSILAAYALVYYKVRGGKFILGLILLAHFLPLPVRIVPTYEMLSKLNLVNSFWGLTLPFFASATGILLFRQFFQTVPVDVVEAAQLDGAGPLWFLFRVLIPISRTNIGALFLVDFIHMWNQYLWPLLVAKTPESRQIQLGIKQLLLTDAAVEWNVLMAGLVIITLPPVVVLALLQNSLVAGLANVDDSEI
jgi:sn-glycerol 3-phosphate transport system permease protein